MRFHFVCQHGAGAAVFSGMRAALLMSDPRKNAVYKRIVLAGGGTLVRLVFQIT